MPIENDAVNKLNRSRSKFPKIPVTNNNVANDQDGRDFRMVPAKIVDNQTKDYLLFYLDNEVRAIKRSAFEKKNVTA